ncbi:MAG: HAD family phosphatase [Anaerolineae bacterium]|nr:HAD family phosphatase [Anaerolineae bacterium]
MKHLPFDAIIFDHDGTLVDTETPDFRAWQTLYKEHGTIITLDHWANVAVGHMNGYAYLFDDLIKKSNNGTNQADLQRRLRELWDITLLDTQLLPGVELLLRELRAHEYRLAVATAADLTWVTRWLTKFNLLSYFETVANRDDVVNNKPAPDVYLLAAERLGVRPERCLVFEDSVAGVQAAKAAGMTVVAVPNQVTKTLDFHQADLIISSLEDVTITWIESLRQT